ncbi:MAG: type II toxin-antitoxin system PemK/MazF family toxin [Acidimicrobiales bacterium]
MDGEVGKPRPAVIIQDDRFDSDSVTICPLARRPRPTDGSGAAHRFDPGL